MKNNTQGFTLIELLIVIAIIGILAAVLIPNLLSARSRAYDTAAQACAKEIQTKQEIYNIDNRVYADATTLFGNADYTPKCDSQIATSGGAAASTQATFTITPSAAGAPVSFSATVKHPNGKKTWTVTPQSISGS